MARLGREPDGPRLDRLLGRRTSGGLFDTAPESSQRQGLLPARAKPVQDTPTPSPNGVAGIVCARLHEITGEKRWRERGEALIRAFAGRPDELGIHTSAYLLAADWHLNPATHLVVVGDSTRSHGECDARGGVVELRSAEGRLAP